MAGLACNTVPVDQTPGGSNNTGGSQSTGGTSASVSASLLEQLSLERINRARLLPAAEAAANNIAIDEGVPGQLNTLPKPPVALNAKLNSAARGHSQDMLARDYFEHNTPEGRTPFQRMEAAGYTFIAAAENLAWRGTTGTADERAYVEAQHVDLFVDTDIPGRGHRLTLLNGNLREVGISIIRGSFTSNGVPYDSVMQTQDYGTSPSGSTFVLGVVYSDGNNNGQYDYGEGVSSSVVSLGPASKTTNAAGGYSFEVFEPGAYTLRFSSSGRSQTLNISQGAPNIKVDLVDGTRVVVNLGVGPL
jgi:uncharacterized protein YkwD